ncbi:MAG: glycosyltransferase, partial [Acidobacteria bacterium]|nr:glycosyltransferase [Acidobacteriota bacterium]
MERSCPGPEPEELREEVRTPVWMPLLAPTELQIAKLASGRPILVIAIDTEAEFDWRGPFLRTLTSVHNLRNQAKAQEIFDRFGVRPIYLVDYSVATQPEGYLPVRDILRSNRCEIGAHLHPWVTPPFDEVLSNRTSFSQNLPTFLQKEKLARLTEAITANLGVQPISYRAGRYGVGEEIADILGSLNYSIDMSVDPGIDMRHRDGPDFRRALDRPYWFGRQGGLLEIPSTSGFTGLIAHSGFPKSFSIGAYRQIARPRLNDMYSVGIFARLRLLERIPLTPEGVTLGELRRVTTTLLSRGQRIFVFNYHSSSLLPG